MARPVELCMKSVRRSTGLGPGAGVAVLCRFPVTLSAQSRGFGARDQVDHGSGRPAGALTHPSFPAAFTEPVRPPGCRCSRAATAVVRVGPFNGAGEGEGTGATARAQNLHSTTIPAGMARPVELCMKSMRNTTGLGPGAGVAVLCRFPVTLSAHSRPFARRSGSTTGYGDPKKPSPPSFPAPFTELHANQGRRESTAPARTTRRRHGPKGLNHRRRGEKMLT
jgi:hypothetical protein